MSNLAVVQLKAFVPAKDFEVSKRFYQDLGFTAASEGGGIGYFFQGNCSFLLQDFYVKAYADNFAMHLLVEDVWAWHVRLQNNGLVQKYQAHGVACSAPETQPWGMIDFVLTDPSGVCWRIGQNTPGFKPIGKVES